MLLKIGLRKRPCVSQYIHNIIIPYVERVRSDIGSHQTALVIIDNFKGQTTQSIFNFLKEITFL